MLIRVILLFLIGMAVLAMFGKLRLPRAGKSTPARCPACGRHRIGKGPCPCGGGRA
jgi:hypothetical protein